MNQPLRDCSDDQLRNAAKSADEKWERYPSQVFSQAVEYIIELRAQRTTLRRELAECEDYVSSDGSDL